MEEKHWSIEHTLFAAALLLGMGVRLYHIGAAPLSDYEASWALQALGLARGENMALGAQPAYLSLTALLFAIFGPTNFMARLLPALAGSALILLPIPFRRMIGRPAALIMAFGLALDPGLVAASRIIGSPMMAVAFGLLCLAALYTRRPVLAGILGGLALLSGPPVLAGALFLALAWLLARLFNIFLPSGLPAEELEPAPKRSWTTFGVALAATTLVVGTLFFRYPQVLGALAATIPAYFGGWLAESPVNPLRLPAALLVYEPLVLIFAIWAAGRAWLEISSGTGGSPAFVRWLSLWAMMALVAGMVYTSRQVFDLTWTIVPLWALAAVGISQGLEARARYDDAPLVALAQAALLFVLLAFAWFNLAGMAQFGSTLNGLPINAGLLLVIGAILMSGITTVLVTLGWSWPVARRGLVWGAGLALSIYMISGMWGATQVKPDGERELWNISPSTGQASSLIETMGDLSQWQTGFRNQIDVVSLVDQPSMRWLLRDWPRAVFTDQISSTGQPSIIITYKEQETPSLTASYRGSDFNWEIYPGWSGVLPPNLFQWLVFRDAPVQEKPIILWARGDLFPGGSTQPGQP